LLAEAGFKPGVGGVLVAPDGRRFSVPLVTTAGNRVRELVELVIKDQLRAVGVEVTIANVSARTLFGEALRERKFEALAMYNFGLPAGAVPFQQFSSHAIPTAANGFQGLNYAGLADPDMDSALTAASAALDAAAQTQTWGTVQSIYARDLPSLPLFAPTKAIITPKWMTGVAPPRETGMMTLWIEDWRSR
jgi:peptide/nickel transport system substrate-binding protein